MTAPSEFPIQMLAEEHILILRALDALEARLRAVEAGAAPDAIGLGALVEFLGTFADRCHHGKEEGLLFPAMVERLEFSPHSGPIAVLCADHDAGRALLAAIAGAAGRLEREPAATGALIEKGRAYIGLLRAHIDREDNKVFPTVEDLLEPQDAARLADSFATFDAERSGGHTASWAASALARLHA